MSENMNIGDQSRFDISFFSYRRLQRDHIQFKRKHVDIFENDFLCRILINYLSYVSDISKARFEKEICDILNDNWKPEDSMHARTKRNFRISVTAELEKKAHKFEFMTYSNFKKNTVISYLLFRYTILSASEREKIYFYTEFKNIKSAILENYSLLIETCNKQDIYEVKPYDIQIDDNSGSYYLIGYSRPHGTNQQFRFYSFKLIRIVSAEKHYQLRSAALLQNASMEDTEPEMCLNAVQKRRAKEISEKFGYAYIVWNLDPDNVEESVVRLTEEGYENFMTTIDHQRPLPLSVQQKTNGNGNIEYYLTFDCSFNQILYYFFSFGAKAEIIMPKDLRERFTNGYKDALNLYDPKFFS